MTRQFLGAASGAAVIPTAAAAQGTPSAAMRFNELIFQPFAIAGPGSRPTGQMLRMDQVITHREPDRDMKQQYFAMADGTGTKWLAHRYSYVRRP